MEIMKNSISAIIPPIIAWHRTNRKPLPWRLDPTPYHVWISEVMLQQTRIEAVIPYYHRFIAELPDIASLAECHDDRLMKLWQGLGYYSRARNLKKAARQIMTEHQGELPCDYASLRQLAGIGDYTAGAIASIALGLPQPAVDGNVLRVLSRVTACDHDIMKASTKAAFISALREVYPSGEDARMLTEGLMELGEIVCIPNTAPKCSQCPIAQLCTAHRRGETLKYPIRSEKAPRRIEKRTVLLLESNGRFAIRKRPDTGLLAGMWEFPSLPDVADSDAIAEFLESEGLVHDHGVQPLGGAVHKFTHVEWHMIGLRIAVIGSPRTLTFATTDEIREHYAIPTAFKKYLSVVYGQN